MSCGGAGSEAPRYKAGLVRHETGQYQKRVKVLNTFTLFLRLLFQFIWIDPVSETLMGPYLLIKTMP